MQRVSYFDVKLAWAGLGWARLGDTVTGYSGMSPVYTAHCAHCAHWIHSPYIPSPGHLTPLDTGPVHPINQLHHVRNAVKMNLQD